MVRLGSGHGPASEQARGVLHGTAADREREHGEGEPGGHGASIAQPGPAGLLHSRRPPEINPVGWMMLADEAAAGRYPVLPGEHYAWLRPHDWRGWPILALDHAAAELHIIAVWSRRPGAFKYLLAAAEGAGWRPVVVSPFPLMASILTRWGWRSTVTGEGWERREEWRPGPRGARGEKRACNADKMPP